MPAASGAQDDEPRTIAAIVAASGGEFDRDRHDYDMLLTAVKAAGLVDALNGDDAQLSVFAPNDRAFVRLARDLGFDGEGGERGAWEHLVHALSDLGGGDPIPVLRNVLLYHVAPGRLGLADVLNADEIETLLDGGTIGVHGLRLVDEAPELRDPRLVRPYELEASNGVVHPIDRVLLPVPLP
ncbi:MAG: fasciclin domain-containing protein [Acidimicrobiales bacterium]